MPEKLRIGILGAGWAASAHATAFSRLPNVEITALWSRTRTRAEALAKEFPESKLQVYDDWRELIEHAEVDAISFATPPTLRGAPLLMALERGCHVLVEKPVTVGLTDADAIINAIKQTNVVTATVFNWRYGPGTQVAKRIIEDGQIGNILDIRQEWRIDWMSREFIEQRPWMRNFESSDGILGEGLSHDFDRIHFLTCVDFEQVVGQLVTRPLPIAPDIKIAGGTSMIQAELSDGIVADIRMTLTPGLPEWSLIIGGETGTLNVTHETAILQCLNEDEATTLEIPVSDKVPEGTDLLQHCWNRLIADFVIAVRVGDKAHTTVPNLPSLEDGLKMQQVISAVRLSDRDRRWVALDELA